MSTTIATQHEPEQIALTAGDVARMLGISTRQVWRLTSAGELPKPARIGARARWDKASVLAWWESQRRKG